MSLTSTSNKQTGTDNTLKLYSKISETNGDGMGLLDVGNNYLNGNPELNVERNVGEAIRHFERAGEEGNLMAQYNLGVLHMQGIGVPVNYTKARELFEEADLRV